jgi:predicted RNA methylase
MTKRVELDKFYTVKETVERCIDLFKTHIEYNYIDLIIEPSAGNGAFIDNIKSLGTEILFYDISPEHPEIIKQDFLRLDTTLKSSKGKVHVIGNPPFGRQSSLAIKFIKKSSEFADTISFILPKSFKKESLKKKIPLNFHMILEEDTNGFVIQQNGIFKKHNVPCVFQIWIKKNSNRIINNQIIPIGFQFVSENPDISLRRVGSNAGLVSTEDLKSKSIQSHYFIKFDNFDQELLNKLKLLNIEQAYYTTGPKSISKSELIPIVNSLILETQKIY